MEIWCQEAFDAQALRTPYFPDSPANVRQLHDGLKYCGGCGRRRLFSDAQEFVAHDVLSDDF